MDGDSRSHGDGDDVANTVEMTGAWRNIERALALAPLSGRGKRLAVQKQLGAHTVSP